MNKYFAEKIHEFILSRLLKETKTGALNYSDSLIDAGIIDSFGIQILLDFLEKEFSIKINEEDLIPENFVTISAITEYVENKLKNRN